MKILVLSPHPDDDIIGCGGSIAKHIAAGNEVSIAFMTSGDVGSGPDDAATLRGIREKEAREGAAELGVTSVFFLHLPDGSVSCDRESIEKTAKVIETCRPDIVYTPHRKDNHNDHRAVHAITLEAVLLGEGRSGHPVKTVLAYEVWTPIERVTYIEDITPYMDQKANALAKHVTQVSNTRFDEAVRGLNKYRGVMKGSGGYSECFEVIRMAAVIDDAL